MAGKQAQQALLAGGIALLTVLGSNSLIAQALDINIGESEASKVALDSPTVTKPTLAEVKSFVARANVYAQTMNVAGYNPMIAADMKFEMNIGGQIVRGGKQQYLTLAKQGLTDVVDYRYKSRTETIAYRGPQAIVQSLVEERIDYGGKKPTYQSISREVAVLEKRNGRLVLTELRSNTNLQADGAPQSAPTDGQGEQIELDN